MRIANNISALNSWRQLNKNQMSLDSSLEKLSSGYRINKAGDDPAGLVLSEQLRAQITGLKQAVRNTQDAGSMIQTAEGSMQEMHSILNEIRSLVLHAKNSGVADSTAIAADQSQVDAAVAALNKIANNTLFGGKNLLNGSLTNRGVVLNSTAVQSVTAGTTAPAGTNLVNFAVTTAATQAVLTGDLDLVGGTAPGGVVNVNGANITITAGANQAAVISTLNAGFATNGLDLTAVASGNFVRVRHNQFGADYSVTINDASSNLYSAGGFNTDAGSDIAGTINGEVATGSGLTLTASAGTAYAGTAVTATSAGNAVAAYASAFSVEAGGLTFQVGSEASDTVTTSITDVRASALGTSAGGANGLNSILAGASYALGTDPTTALAVIDEAISDVSTARSQLGAIQKYTLATKINSLNVAIENVTASESRVRDVDMAAEMASYTKSQVLVQSATAMLGQANSQPQSVLSLLQRL
jgi:flagellin